MHRDVVFERCVSFPGRRESAAAVLSEGPWYPLGLPPLLASVLHLAFSRRRPLELVLHCAEAKSRVQVTGRGYFVHQLKTKSVKGRLDIFWSGGGDSTVTEDCGIRVYDSAVQRFLCTVFAFECFGDVSDASAY